MAGELEKWAKRHKYPVDLGDGITCYVKPMTFSQMRVDADFDANERTVWYLACCLCDETSAQLIPQEDGEDIKTYLARASETINPLEAPVVRKAMDAITRIMSPTDTDTLVKN